jgi:hypothetical protein
MECTGIKLRIGDAITYKEVFPLIKDNKLWLGPSIKSGNREFVIPSGVPSWINPTSLLLKAINIMDSTPC